MLSNIRHRYRTSRQIIHSGGLVPRLRNKTQKCVISCGTRDEAEPAKSSDLSFQEYSAKLNNMRYFLDRAVFGSLPLSALILFFSAIAWGEPSEDAIVFPILTPRVSSGFGFRVHPIRGYSAKHQGIDLAVPENSHVRAIMAGRVVFADRYAGFGKLVTVDHGKGRTSLYGHLSEILVNVGEKIPAGALLGRVGSTGMATGPHLHFEWRIQGKSVDPMKVFPSLASDADG